MKILVTGGAGYIGSHACLRLREAGHTPVVYDNLVYGHRASSLGWEVIEGDLGDGARLREVFKTHEIEAVMHFAAYAYVGESVKDPARYFDNNVVRGLLLLDAMRHAGVNRIIFSSTCATYGEPLTETIDEGHPQSPINPYGESKLFFEKILARYAEAYGLQSISLRYFNAAGADPDGRIGESHDPETHLIPLVLAAAQGRRDHVAIFGDDYDTPDGTCIRDYIHVSDLAEAHLLALEALARGEGDRVYNLGNGRGFSVRQVIETAEQVTGRGIRTIVSGRRPGDPARLVAAGEKARRELGWQPRYDALSDIIETAWRWEQKRRY